MPSKKSSKKATKKSAKKTAKTPGPAKSRKGRFTWKDSDIKWV
jgi:hypothetical protein